MDALGAPLVGLLDMAAARVGLLRARIGRLTGWRRAALAVIFGLCATAALPPVHVTPLLFVAFPGLLWLLDAIPLRPRSAPRTAFMVAWWFGVGHFLAGFYWLSYALLLDAAHFGWMVPFALFGLAGGLALFPAAAVALYHRAGYRGAAGILVFACVWTLAEWLRGHVLTGFPWNLIGTVWAANPAMMQGAAVFGLYGLGTLTVVAAALPATLAGTGGRSVRGGWAGIAAALAILLAGWIGGNIRLAGDVSATVPDVRLRLVQPNVPQTLKWDPEARVANFRKSLELSRAPGFETRTDVIWSETAVPFVLTDFNQDGPAIREALASVTPPGGLLITGGLRAERQDGELALWNSLFALDDGGRIVGSYDKHHLVPFGEYVPLPHLLAFAKVSPGAIDLMSGPGPRTLELPGLPPASPLICYEAIFPGEVTDPAHRPAWLLNISNDAWFGISAGPYQHFAAARFRAVEEGLPLVRATNDGISAVVDAFGRRVAELGLGQTGILDANLPAALSPTVYARWGDWALLGLVVLLLGLARALARAD